MPEVITKGERENWDSCRIPVNAETLLDISTFFNLDTESCQTRLDKYRMSEMAEMWNKLDPQSPEQIRRFYQETELYIWELSKWHASESYQIYLNRVAEAIRAFPPSTHPRVLDFGSGIATASIEFAKIGYQVTLADVPGRTLAFAKHRFQRRGLSYSVIEVTNDIPHIPGIFDIVVSFDVLEHIPEAEMVMRRLVQSLRTGGAALIVASFDDHGEHPQHLPSNIDRFRKVPWDWALVGAGLRFEKNGMLVKAPLSYSLPRRVRWLLHSSIPFLPAHFFYQKSEW